MTLDVSTAEELLSAFKAMPKRERDSFFHLVSQETALQEDLAEAFVAALRALRSVERDEVLEGIIRQVAAEPELLEDILDSALIIQREDEPSRSFREYLAERDQ